AHTPLYEVRRSGDSPAASTRSPSGCFSTPSDESKAQGKNATSLGRLCSQAYLHSQYYSKSFLAAAAAQSCRSPLYKTLLTNEALLLYKSSSICKVAKFFAVRSFLDF